jgi:GTP cyclohydrolase II
MSQQEFADGTTVHEHQSLLDSYDELMESTEHLARMLRSTKAQNRKTRSQLQKGSSIRDVFTTVPTGDLRQSFTQAMAEVESARHKVRRMAFARGLEEGMTIGELGRIWGFSRQLAARYAKEARNEL